MAETIPLQRWLSNVDREDEGVSAVVRLAGYGPRAYATRFGYGDCAWLRIADVCGQERAENYQLIAGSE